jgi:DNA repair protein RecN (Recombination protein N)
MYSVNKVFYIMIKYLILNNLVLIDTCEIHFSPSFNVVTGETGAGKTALIEAIGLALGDRADSALIRKGCDRAFIEVAFEIKVLEHLKAMLEEAGLSLDPGEFLVVRREIAKEGKNRAFINCRMVPLPFLQKIGEELIDLIGQRTHQLLLHSDAQRDLVDLFGGLEADLKVFQAAYAHEKELQKQLEGLQQFSSHREKNEEIWRLQLEEIESIGLKKTEEEAVYEKYQRLANAQEISEKIEMVIRGLSESSSAVLSQLSSFSRTCDSLLAYDQSFSEPANLIHESQIGLSEALRFLQSYSQNIDNDPNTFQFLENRLNAIARLKRKYGSTFEEIESFLAKIKAELAGLANLSDQIQTAENALKRAHIITEQAAQELTIKRKEIALRLQKALSSQLQYLNMSGAEVIIDILVQPRNLSGDDLIQFWIKANPGELPGLVKEHSSGGELSRLLFAIKTVLAEKNNTPTLIFDEIDANVGGKTASIMGEYLQELGKHRQVICITHFPQVASAADTHFRVQKKEVEGRTKTEIRHLSKKEREQELLRMLGGKKLFETIR